MLLHCLNNDRMLHMMPMDGGGGAGENEASDESTFSGAEEDDAGLDSGSMAGPFPEDWMDAVVQVGCSKHRLPLFSPRLVSSGCTGQA